MAVRIEILRHGQPVASIDGVEVDGPARGARNVSYHGRGNVVSDVGKASFELPLAFARNNAVTRGTEIAIRAEGVADPVFEGIVQTRGRRVGRDGLFARFEAYDLLVELAKPTVTTGFVARAGETTTALFERLLARRTETRWRVDNRIAGYDGANFSAYGISVLQAAGKACGERFASYKRGPTLPDGTRTLVAGRFGAESSGLRLVRAPREAHRAAENPDIRVIADVSVDEDAALANRLIPLGAGDGAAQLTLAPLYGLTSGPGYNPAYPVLRRLREDAVAPYTATSYEYYIEDAPSIAAHDLSERAYPRTDIVPVSTTAADYTVAAWTLYRESLRYLIDHKESVEQITVTTVANGELLDLGGTTVEVHHDEVNADGDLALSIHGTYQVLTVERRDATGAATDVWTLSTGNRRLEGDGTLFAGALEAIDYLRMTPTLFPDLYPWPFDDFVDASSDIEVIVPGHRAIARVQEARVYVYFRPVRSPTRPKSHMHTVTTPDHTHPFTVPNHAHGFSVPDHAHSFALLDHTHSFSLGDHSHGVSGGGHDHSVSSGDHGHGFDFGAHSHAILKSPVFVDIGKSAGHYTTATVSGTEVVTSITAFNTDPNHTHGMGRVTIQAAPSVNAGGGFNVGSSGYGGFNVGSSGGGGTTSGTSGAGGTTSGTSAAGGATSSTSAYGSAQTSGAGGGTVTSSGAEVGVEWGLLTGPQPTLVQVYCNEQYAGQLTASGAVDVTPWWQAQADNRVRLKSFAYGSNPTGLGRLTGAVLTRPVLTTVATQQF
jgi:hypothetical protein